MDLLQRARVAPADQPPDPMTVKSYSLKFTQPGRYEYICIPHYPMGMDATVVVEATSAGAAAPGDGANATAGGTDGMAAGMPSTGSGSEAGWLLAAVAAALLLALSGAVVRLRLGKGNRLQ